MAVPGMGSVPGIGPGNSGFMMLEKGVMSKEL